MKKNISKYGVVLGIGLLIAVTAPLRADDNQSTTSGDNNKQQTSQNSQSSDGQSKGGNSDNGGGYSMGTVSPVQSSADPYGLKIAGPVMEAGSTAASANFDKNVLPSALQLSAKSLPDGHNNLNSPAFAQKIDMNKLVLVTKQAVTATFISMGAGYQNSLGF